MAMVFDSEEESNIEAMLDESDDDDDDYVPDGGNSDSDPEYGKRKRKSTQHSPNKRTRSTRSSSSENTPRKSNAPSAKNKSNTKPTTGRMSTPYCGRGGKRSKSADQKKLRKKKDEGSSLRRSSRSTRARGVSYADADVSDEEYFQEEELFHSEGSDDVYEQKNLRKEKKELEKKKHVEGLWSSFKSDVSKKQDNDSTEKKLEKKGEDTEEVNVKEIQNKDKVLDTEKEKNEKTEIKEDITKSHVNTKKEVQPKTDLPIEENSKGDGNNCADNNIETSNENIDEKNNISEKVEKSKDKGMEPSSNDIKKDAITKDMESNKDVETKSDRSKNKDVQTSTTSSNKSAETNKTVEPATNKILSTSGKIKVTQVYDFAGEEIKISKEVDAESKEGKQALGKETESSKIVNKPSSSGINNILSSGLKKTGGLSGVLGSIDKKKKIGVLDKSKYDWDNYKSEAGLEDELKPNRNAGYLDRQEFLQRVDFKQWENEREMRLYSNRK